ncbi:MAG TPA: TIGR00725 family protein [Coleofasciculaceae cyanobacterium]
MRKPIVGVMGAGDRATLPDREIAYSLGQQIAAQGWILLTGGRAVGVMDAASRGAKQANGLTIGILPGSSHEGVSAAVDIAILTGLGDARNAINVLTSDVIFACGLGAGTASEIALALKANKSVILVNADAKTQAFFQNLSPEQVFRATDPLEAIFLAKEILQTLGLLG